MHRPLPSSFLLASNYGPLLFFRSVPSELIYYANVNAMFYISKLLHVSLLFLSSNDLPITAAVTLVTAPGGEPNDFNSVRLFLFNVFKASCAADRAGSAFTKSSSQSIQLQQRRIYENN